MRFFIVDDDTDLIELQKSLLEAGGHRVWSTTSAEMALSQIPKARPQCILIDIMMPGMDGLELCAKLRQDNRLVETKIIVVSAKHFEYDRKRAMELGADAFIPKPIQPATYLDKLTAVVQDRLEIRFWGVRGTLPVPGPDTVEHGGNTSCVTVEFPRDQFFIFDAGSGIRALSEYLLKSCEGRQSAKIFLSHPHWDHINALPFFAPLYIQGNELEILGASQSDTGVRELVAAQMNGVYFPIKAKDFAANVEYRDLTEGNYEVTGIAISTILLSHPGNCLGYRIDYNGRRICYITDNELYPASTPYRNQHFIDRLTRFVEGADVLITDSTYTDEEYLGKIHWGHSPISEAVEIAHNAAVKRLYLFHHDPKQTDRDIDRKLETALDLLGRRGSKTDCTAPYEGLCVDL